LDSYHRERHPVGQALLRTTDRAFSLAASPAVLPRFIRGHLLPQLAPRVLTIPAIRRLAVGLVSQLRIAYPDSPLNAENGNGWRHGPRPGDRAREGDVIGAGVTRIFEVLRGTHHPCYFSPPAPTPADCSSTPPTLSSATRVSSWPGSSAPNLQRRASRGFCTIPRTPCTAPTAQTSPPAS
ncbi:MAG: hypothetical protein ACRDUV_00090, partial [Pseudonocardiaceae bacterium]